MKKFKGTIDIHSKGKFSTTEETKKIAMELSNFCPHAFTFDGVECASMEGFLQSLKYICPEDQKAICTLAGKTAKEAGDGKKRWELLHEAYWQGKTYDRLSFEYDMLIMRAYRAMYAQNEDFRDALAASEGYNLRHTIGCPHPKKTILTEREFIRCLYRCRMLKAE